MELQGNLTPADLEAAWKVHEPGIAQALSSGLFLDGLGLLIGGATVVYDHSNTFGWVIFATCYLLLVLMLAWRRRLAAVWTSLAEGMGRYTLEVSEAGVIMTSATQDSRIKWAAYIKAHEHPGGFLLYHSKESYAVLPKRMFRTQEDLEAMRALIRTQIQAGRPTTG